MQLLHNDIWKTVATNKAKGSTMAAVAYVNKDHLQLKEGDTLICDASDGRIATGATSAKVLTKLSKRKVQLFHLPSLHAKVVRMPKHVLLGSANMTSNAENLEEASILSAEPALLAQVDAYFMTLKGNDKLRPINAKFLDRISKIKVLLRGGAPKRVASADPVTSPQVWITRIKHLSDRATHKTYEDAVVATGIDYTDQPFYRIPISYERPLPQRGDFIVQVHRESNLAMQPACVKSICETATHVIFLFKPPGAEKTISWRRLGEVLKSSEAFNRRGVPTMLSLDAESGMCVRKLYEKTVAC